MTLLAQIDKDIEKAFYDTKRGFAEDCETPASTIPVIFDEDYFLSQPGSGIGITSNQPVAKMRQSDACTLSVGHILFIRKKTYSIIEFQDTGKGEVLAVLREQ